MKLTNKLAQVTLKMKEKGSTGRMGLSWMTHCMDHFGVKEMTRRVYQTKIKSNREINPFKKMMSVVMMRVSGGDRVEDVEVLRADNELVNSLGWDVMPSADTTLNYLGNKESNKNNLKINEAIVLKAMRKSKLEEFTYDNDATYFDSEKESASYSYNKTKQFSALLGSISELKLINTFEFRTGSASPAFGIYGQLRQANEQARSVGKKIKIFRSDAAAYQNVIMRYCNAEEIEYYITVNKTTRTMKVIDDIEQWEVLRDKKGRVTDKKWAVSEYETFEGLKIRIMILRWRNPDPDLFESRPYCYHVIGMNNKKIAPMAWIKLHSGRMGTIEYFHKELKRELGCAYNPSHDFEKNRGYFLLGVMAYNMVQIMKLYYFDKEYERMSIKRFRYQFINVCGRIVKTGRRFYCQIINTTNQIYEMYRSCKAKLIISGY
jgi:hypothetical protein